MSDSDSPKLGCSICGAGISEDQLVRGQAVRVSGQAVCPMCVDTLPADARIRIDQLRAMRGFEATTYRYRLPRHPEVEAYTFTSSAALMQHRRLRNQGERLDAPLIAPRSDLQSASGPRAGLPRGLRTPILIVSAVAAAVVLGLVFWPSGAESGSDEARTETPDATSGTAPPGPHRTRADYPEDPRTAFDAASAELPIEDEVLHRVAAELATDRTAELERARLALAAGDAARAAQLLENHLVPSHPLLRQTQRQEADLRQAITEVLAERRLAEERRAAERAAADPDDVDEAEPVVDEQTTDDGGKAEPEPEPEPEPQLPPQLVYRLPASALLEAEETASGWTAADDGSLVLSERSGSVDRFLSRPAGELRWWLRLAAGVPGGRLLVRLGEETVAVDATTATEAGWIALTGVRSGQTGTPLRLGLVATGGAWRIAELAAVAGGDEMPPRSAGEPVAWTEALEPPAPPGRILPLRFVGEVRTLDPHDPTHRVPEGLPGNVEGMVYASTPERRKQQLTIDLGEQDLTDGRLALLLHPSPHPARLSLTAILEDAAGREVEIEDIALGNRAWQPVVVNLLQVRDPTFDREHVVALTLRDTERAISLPFYIAKLAASTGAAAGPDLLRLSERALQPVDPQALAELVATTFRIRAPDGDWRTDFEPGSYRILVGHHLFTDNWRRDCYAALAERTGQRPPPGTASVLVMDNDWLEDAFVMPPDVADQRAAITVIATAGIEFQFGLDRRQALRNFWHTMLSTAIGSGILPVVVLGPTKADPEHRQAAEQMWAAIETMVAEELPGVPVIDLRPVGAADADRFGPGQARRSAELLAEGIAELQERLRALQQAAQR